MRSAPRCATAFVLLAALMSPAAAGGRAPALSLLLRADPVLVPSADQLKLSGDVAGRPGTAVRDSMLTVRDASGRAVFSSKDAFLFQWSDGKRKILAPASGYSGPRLPASLPRGAYTAVWTVDGRTSNVARFAVGSGKPRYLTIEGLEENYGGACLLVHVYVWEPLGAEFCGIVFGVNLFVDGRETKLPKGCMGPGTGSRVSGGFSFAYGPRELGAKGRHKASARYRTHRSEEVAFDCRPAPKF